jgi:hypothetical protein
LRPKDDPDQFDDVEEKFNEETISAFDVDVGAPIRAQRFRRYDNFKEWNALSGRPRYTIVP